MTTILICPLGQAPGVVTGTLDALIDPDPPVSAVCVNKVVLLWLHHPDDEKLNVLPETVRILKEEFSKCYADVELDLDAGRLILSDVRDEESNNLFYQRAADVIQKAVAQPDTQVLVSVSGGRKTMATLTFLAAYLYEGADTVYHLVVDDDIEEIATPAAWLNDHSLRKLALHPPKDKRKLIRLPSFPEISKYRAHGQVQLTRPEISTT